MLEHGGRLRRAAQQSGIQLEQWLDLSTGISPWSWLEERPLSIPASCWTRLPEDDDGLREAAHAYYGAQALPVAGSQAAIQNLPRLRPLSRVGLLKPCYAEHAQAWQRAGHIVTALDSSELLARADDFDVIVLVQPNNPDASQLPASTLRALHRGLAARGGWLVIDEAFIDATPQASLAADSDQPGLIVLRSLGKFFGLAGARVGFVLAEAAVRKALQELLGPWTLNGPARQVATAALRDCEWQALQRSRLQLASARLHRILQRQELAADGYTALFHWLRHDDAISLHQHFARAAILTRHFSEPASLRLGLPRSEQDWDRLETALSELPLTLHRRTPCRERKPVAQA